MTPRSQNKPPRSTLTFQKSSSVSGSLPDKRMRIGAERRTPRGGGTAKVRQPLAAVTNRQDSPASVVGGTEASECENMEFTNVEVHALLNEKFRGKKFDHKAKMEHMADNVRRLKLCLRWFQEVEERNAQEKENLQGALDTSEEKCRETELALRKKEEELKATITELKNQNASLQEKLRKEVSEKLDALELYSTEKEARVASERLQDSLRENLARSEQEISDANQKLKSLSVTIKRMQEYNTSLQQHSSNLQEDLNFAKESLTRADDEKVAMVQDLSSLRIKYSLLQDRLTSSGLKSVSDMHNRMQEYSSSLQQYSDSLQADLKLANESLTRADIEKVTAVLNLCTLTSSGVR